LLCQSYVQSRSPAVGLFFTSDKGGGTCDCPRCLFVCSSVRKITNKRLHGFGWNFACRQMSGRGRTDQLLSPIRVIVRMPEPENLKAEDLSKSVKQAPHSEQAIGHGMHCTGLKLHVLVQGPGSFAGPVDFPTPRTVAELRGVKVAQFSHFGPFSPYKTAKMPKR